MTAKRRKPVEAKRVPLNCLVQPSTKQEILERATNGKSQGQVIDEAVSALYRETGTAYEPPRIVVADIDMLKDEVPAETPLAITLNHRRFKGPPLKPKDQEK